MTDDNKAAGTEGPGFGVANKVINLAHRWETDDLYHINEFINDLRSSLAALPLEAENRGAPLSAGSISRAVNHLEEAFAMTRPAPERFLRKALEDHIEILKKHAAQVNGYWWITTTELERILSSTPPASSGTEGLLERVARALERAYWRGRGETITKEQEDEFWLSSAREADASLRGDTK